MCSRINDMSKTLILCCDWYLNVKFKPAGLTA